MADDKDRLGDTLRDKQRGEEDQYFKQKEKEAIEKTRRAREDEVKALARDRCPRCGERLTAIVLHGVTLDECAAGHGTWFDKGELEQLATRERDSWIARYLIRPKSVT